MKLNHYWGAMAAVSTVRALGGVPAAAFSPLLRAPQQYHHCSWRCMHRKVTRRRRQFALRSTGSTSELELGIEKDCISPPMFVEDVILFLDADGIPWRHLSEEELRRVLGHHLQDDLQRDAPPPNRVDEMMALLEDRTILAVGTKQLDTCNNKSQCQPYTFILQLCPTPNLQSMQVAHHKYQPDSSVSQTVAAYACLNAHITNAFFSYDDTSNQHAGENNMSGKPLTSVVHLHQDVWHRSPEIVQSRLRSKCGMFRQRVYARQTVAKRISKSQYLPFLEKNHLWGATGAKYGYGLFLKPKQKQGVRQLDDDTDQLVAVATFSNNRKVTRGTHAFHSFELLRFCTTLDTTIVGGLTKLVAAFVKDIRSKNAELSGDEDAEIDIITSIDRDFGCNTWPNFEQMEVMVPVPMFVGDDGLRRHAVGAGLTPLEQGGGSSSMTASMLLRAGLPDSLLMQLNQQDIDGADLSWRIAADHGFHPVFDAGVERLMMVVKSDESKHLSPVELWEKSIPRYVTEHYSPNSGIDAMLKCIRRNNTILT